MPEDSPLRAALAYVHDLGWPIFPITPGLKTPLYGSHGFKDAAADPAQIRRWWGRWPQANIGLACGAAGLVVVDLDVKNDAGGLAVWAALLARHGLEVEAPTSCTPSGGRHLFFAAPPGFKIRNSAGRLAPGIDVRAEGGYVLLPPSRIRQGAYPGCYAWESGAHPGERPLLPLPAELAAILAFQPEQIPYPAPAAGVRGGTRDYGRAVLESEVARLRRASPGTRNDQLNRSAFALGRLVGPGLLQRTEVTGALERAALDIGLSRHEARRTIQSGLEAGLHHLRAVPEPRHPAPPAPDLARPGAGEGAAKSPTPRPTPPAPCSEAESRTVVQCGAKRRSEAKGRNTPHTSRPTPPCDLALTDYGNAERLVARHGGDLRYCRPWSQWLVWDARRWRPDDTGEVERRAKATVRAIYGEAAQVVDDEARKALVRWAVRSEARAKIEAMIGLAGSEPGVPVRPAELDADPWRLNVQNGTLDLRSGALHPHDRADLITRLAAVDYDPDAPAPAWHAFLERILGGDPELIAFVQRALGYALTGDTREQVLFILHGSGANGKSTLLEAVGGVMGDYALVTMVDTLMVRYGSTVPNDVARLRGARLVVAVEPEEGQRLAEGRVKQLTGGDRIAARFLRQEFFEFRPEFKLFLATNHKPDVRGTDDAIWRRVRMVPFAVRIPEAEQDKTLRDKLAAEAAGILAWLVRGCLDWQRDGLGLAPAVRAATAGYRAEMDRLAGFLEECCILRPDAQVTVKALYEAYVAWCTANGEPPLAKRTLCLRLRERGLEVRRGTGGVHSLHGIGLLGGPSQIQLRKEEPEREQFEL